MFARIPKLLRATWQSLGLIGTVIGIIYIWPDIRGLPETFGFQWGFPMWLDREVVAYVALGGTLAWIAWIDIRPFVKQWWDKRGRPSHFIVHNNVYCEARNISSEEKEEDDIFYEHIYYLSVGNGLETGQTLRRVQARIHFALPPVVCKIKDMTDDSIELRHGEWAYFEIGRLVSKEIFGVMSGRTKTKETFMKSYRHNVQSGHLSFEIHSVSKGREYGLGSMKDVETQWTLYIVISADDVKSATVKIDIDMTNTQTNLICERIN